MYGSRHFNVLPPWREEIWNFGVGFFRAARVHSPYKPMLPQLKSYASQYGTIPYRVAPAYAKRQLEIGLWTNAELGYSRLLGVQRKRSHIKNNI